MKLLAFVDMHGSLRAMEKLKEKGKRANVILCAGDISIFEQRIEYFLKEFNKLKKPFLIIPGNHEDDEHIDSISTLFGHVYNIHKKTKIIGDYLFLGYGSGGFSVLDREFERVAKRFRKEITKLKKKNPKLKTILVTHAPPYKTKLDVIEGSHVGNKSIRLFIKETKIDMVVCGHLHENAGKEEKIGKTRIINPGMFGRLITM